MLLNAGFCIPKLAAISQAMLDATQLPVWMNVYLSRPGMEVSTQLHTDKTDRAKFEDKQLYFIHGYANILLVRFDFASSISNL